MTKYLIIDDHVVTRTGIKFLLFEKYSPADIYEAHNGETARQLLSEHKFELVIMDVQMPDTDTLSLMDHIRTNYPDSKVLVYSMSSENIYARRFMKSGAMGFLTKDAPLKEVTAAIDSVLNSKKYISKNFAETLAEDLFSQKNANPFEDLSKREFEIAKLLLSGQTLTDISQQLNIQTSTVGTHKHRLFEKLKVNNLLELKDLANSYKI